MKSTASGKVAGTLPETAFPDGFDARRCLAVQGLCRTLASPLKHLHGLPKTAVAWLEPAALLASLCRVTGKYDGLAEHQWLLSQRYPGLTEAQWRVVRCAVQASAGVTLSCRTTAERELAQRLGAVLRIAGGIVAAIGPTAEVVSAVDTGKDVEVVVSDGTRRAVDVDAMRVAVDLWNGTLLRPLRLTWRRGGKSRPAVRPAPALEEIACHVLQRQAEQLTSRVYGVSMQADPEFVHEMRVATRRARAAFRFFKPVLSRGLRTYEADFRWLGNMLGTARDADVSLDYLQHEVQRLPAARRGMAEHLVLCDRRRRAAAYRRLLRGLREPRYGRAAEGFRRAVALQRVAASRRAAAAGSIKARRRTARKLLRRALKRVLRFDTSLPRLSAMELHALRIACKKLRYAAEFLGELYGDAFKRLIAVTVGLQDALGSIHDAHVYVDRIDKFVVRHGPRDDRSEARKGMENLRRRLRRRCRESLAEAQRHWRTFTSRRFQEKLAARMNG